MGSGAYHFAHIVKFRIIGLKQIQIVLYDLEDIGFADMVAGVGSKGGVVFPFDLLEKVF